MLFFCCLAFAEPPFIQPQPSELDVILNNPILLPCEATGIPTPFITWQKEGINVITSGTYHISIKTVTVDVLLHSSEICVPSYKGKIKFLFSLLSWLWYRQEPCCSSQWRLTDLQSCSGGCWHLHVCGSKPSWYSLGQDQAECTRYLSNSSSLSSELFIAIYTNCPYVNSVLASPHSSLQS